MSGPDDGSPPRSAGRRKDGRPYKAGNTREDGGYEVGRNRPPVKGQFIKGDGRQRGRRPKGVRNADTEFERELKRRITVREDGKERRVTKSLGVDLRLIDNASRKGDNRAIELVDQRRRRIEAEREETARRYHTLSDVEILETFLRDRSEEFGLDPRLLGDPEPPPDPEQTLAQERDHG